jgi:hypothetical protein
MAATFGLFACLAVEKADVLESQWIVALMGCVVLLCALSWRVKLTR